VTEDAPAIRVHLAAMATYLRDISKHLVYLLGTRK
jgi:hypothetical protein